MSKQQHTPGPWAYRGGGHVTTTDSERASRAPSGVEADVAIVCVNPEQAQRTKASAMPSDEAKANARLIAAAPDLLKSLDRMERAARQRESTMGDQCSLIDVQRELRESAAEARAVIAEATGTQ